MKTQATRWLILAAAMTTMMLPTTARADAQSHMDNVDRLVQKLLNARDDDKREKAAERLGDIAGGRALDALRFAARHDRENDVRKEARKAARRIRARLAARKAPARPKRVIVTTPPRRVEYVRPARPVIRPLPARRRPAVVVQPAPRRTTRPHPCRRGREFSVGGLTIRLSF